MEKNYFLSPKFNLIYLRLQLNIKVIKVILLFALIFGVLPSEWLNLSQGPLEWTNQREFINFPPILFLGNEIGMSLGALKDIIQLGISGGALVTAFVVGYLIQDINEAKERGKTRVSDYGKQVVKVGADG